MSFKVLGDLVYSYGSLIGTWLSYPMFSCGWWMYPGSIHLPLHFFLLLDNFSCVHHRFWSSPLPISFLSISSLFPYHDSLLTSWDIIHCILKAHWVLLVLPVCAWTEGDLSSEWVIHITLFLTRLWDCCGRRGRKHLRARGSEWMSAVKQSLLDMNSWWLWRQSQDLNKINPNVDGR